MQAKLDALYNEYLDKIFSDEELLSAIENYELSSPQFLDVSVTRGNYLKHDNKVVFIGKETNGWFNQAERSEAGLAIINKQNQKYIEALKSIYFTHNIGVNYRTSIYTFIDLLTDKLAKNVETGILLTEVLRHDYLCRGLPPELIPKIAYNNNYILKKEIEILNPNAVVFLTGPTYDPYIKLTYPDITFSPLPNYPINQVAIIEGIPNIKKAIRIYHPDAHKYQGEDFRYAMVETVSNYIKQI
ncbi:MAG: hypothetical protein ABI169_17820 [Chitinophagaceae bacterium]